MILAVWYFNRKPTTYKTIEKEVKFKCVPLLCDSVDAIQIFIRDRDFQIDKPTGAINIRKGVYSICCNELAEFLEILKGYAEMDIDTKIPGPRRYLGYVNVQPFIMNGERGFLIANKKSGHVLTGGQFKQVVAAMEKLKSSCCSQ